MVMVMKIQKRDSVREYVQYCNTYVSLKDVIINSVGSSLELHSVPANEKADFSYSSCGQVFGKASTIIDVFCLPQQETALSLRDWGRGGYRQTIQHRPMSTIHTLSFFQCSATLKRKMLISI